MDIRHKNIISKLYISLAVAIGISMPVSAFGDMDSLGGSSIAPDMAAVQPISFQPPSPGASESNQETGTNGDQNSGTGTAEQTTEPNTPLTAFKAFLAEYKELAEQIRDSVTGTDPQTASGTAPETPTGTDPQTAPAKPTATLIGPKTDSQTDNIKTMIQNAVDNAKESADSTAKILTETSSSVKSEPGEIARTIHPPSENRNSVNNDYTENKGYSLTETSHSAEQNAQNASNTQTNEAPAQQTGSYALASATSVNLGTPLSPTRNQPAANPAELIITPNNGEQNLSIATAATASETAYTQIMNTHSGKDSLVKDILEKPISQTIVLAQTGANILRFRRSANTAQTLRAQTDIVTTLAKNNYFVQSSIFILKQSLLSSGTWVNSIQLLREQIARKASSGYEIKEFKKLGGLFLNRLLPVLKFTIAAIDDVVMNALKTFNGHMPASSDIPDNTRSQEGLPASPTAKPDLTPSTYALSHNTVRTLNTSNIAATAFIDTDTIINAVNYTKTGLSPPGDIITILPYQTVSLPLQTTNTFILSSFYPDPLIHSKPFNSVIINNSSFINSIATAIKTDCGLFICPTQASKLITNKERSAENSLNKIVFYKNAPQKRGGEYVS